MKKTKIICLLILLICFFPSVNAQIVTETKINVNNDVVVEHSTAGNHHIEITRGDSVRVIHSLYNYFDADWVDIAVSYSVVYGDDLISEITTSGLFTYWNQKGDWGNFEFYFVAEETGKVWIVFHYNGTYWEELGVSQPKTFSSIASFSSIRFEIVEKSLPYTTILFVIIGVSVVVVSSIFLFHKRRKTLAITE